MNHHYHLLFMQLFLKVFSGMANIVDPDQTAPSGSASALFAYDVLSEISQQAHDVNTTLPERRCQHCINVMSAPVAQLDARSTGDQEVAGSTPALVGNILSWRSIMKYFLQSFSPFH